MEDDNNFKTDIKKGTTSKLISLFFVLMGVVALVFGGFWLFGFQELCSITDGMVCLLQNPYSK